MGKIKKFEKENLGNQVAVSSRKIANVPSIVYFLRYLEFHLYVYIKSHQKTTKKNYLQWLIENNYYSECNKYFCNGWLQYAKNKLNKSNGTVNVENQEALENSQNNKVSKNKTIGDTVAYILKLIK